MLVRTSLTKSTRVLGAAFALWFGLFEFGGDLINHRLTVGVVVRIVVSVIIVGCGMGLVVHYKKMIDDNRAPNALTTLGTP